MLFRSARVKRIAAVNKDISSWQERLGNAKTRAVELEQRHSKAEADLATALAEPDNIISQRAELISALEEAETRRKLAADTLARAEMDMRQASEAERDAGRVATESREKRAGAEARSEAASDALRRQTHRLQSSFGLALRRALKLLWRRWVWRRSASVRSCKQSRKTCWNNWRSTR